MHLIFLPRKEHGQEPVSSDKSKEELVPSELDLNIADGGEFLDDGIRMKEQPFNKTETRDEQSNPGQS